MSVCVWGGVVHFDLHPYSPLVANQVDAERVGGDLYEARQGQVGVEVPAQVTGTQSQAVVHQAAHKPAGGGKGQKGALMRICRGSQCRFSRLRSASSNGSNSPANIAILI